MSQSFSFGNGTVTLCHSKTKDLNLHTINADIIIVAVGVPYLLKSNMIKDGCHIIDVGINRIDDPTTKKDIKLLVMLITNQCLVKLLQSHLFLEV